MMRQEGGLQHIEYVKEVADHPDYESALSKAKSLLYGLKGRVAPPLLDTPPFLRSERPEEMPTPQQIKFEIEGSIGGQICYSCSVARQ